MVDASNVFFSKLQITLSVFKAYVYFFKQAWDRGVFMGDYGLRQVAVRAGVSPLQMLDAQSLVLVDAEALKQKEGARKIGHAWTNVWKELDASLGEQGYQMPPTAMPVLRGLITVTNMDW